MDIQYLWSWRYFLIVLVDPLSHSHLLLHTWRTTSTPLHLLQPLHAGQADPEGIGGSSWIESYRGSSRGTSHHRCCRILWCSDTVSDAFHFSICITFNPDGLNIHVHVMFHFLWWWNHEQNNSLGIFKTANKCNFTRQTGYYIHFFSPFTFVKKIDRAIFNILYATPSNNIDQILADFTTVFRRVKLAWMCIIVWHLLLQPCFEIGPEMTLTYKRIWLLLWSLMA